MTRLKFLAFALIALGLWVAHLFIVSPAIAAVAKDQAAGHAVAAPAAVALRLESTRSELQAAVLKLASTPAITNPGPKTAKPEAPTPDRFNMVRTAVLEGLPEALRAIVVVGVGNDVGALVAVGPAEPAAPPEGFDAKAAAAAGGKGEVLDAFGGPHILYSVPLFVVDKNEVRAAGAAFVGLPLAVDPKKLVEGVAKDLSLSAVGLSIGGKVVAAGGPNAALIEQVKANPGEVKAVVVGAATELGPLKLPMLTEGDLMGGSATLEMGVRRDIPGTPFEVIAVAPARATMDALGGYQKTALFMLVGLLVAAIAFTLLMGGGSSDDDEAYVAPRAPLTGPVVLPPKPEPAALPIADAPPAPEAHPDDFDFGPATPAAPAASKSPSKPPQMDLDPVPAAATAMTQEAPKYVPPPVEDPGEDPFASLGPPVAAPPPPPPARAAPPVMSLGDDDFESQRTTSYPAHGYKNPMAMASTQSNPAVDPFAMAGGMMSADEQMQGDSPDATRVAVIPQELLKQSKGGNTKENPMPLPKTLPMQKVAPVASVASAGTSEDVHFQEVFRDFVATREKCGEPADGLTFDKFVAKLRKNKEQLVQKYNCKTVRFQVYVKEGKAALKATPVKD